jgi:hypothetical protein
VDGHSVHRAENTIAYLATMNEILEGWPGGQPGTDLIDDTAAVSQKGAEE